MATPVGAQTHFRLYYNDSANVDTCSALALEDTSATIATGSANAFIVRCALENDNSAVFNEAGQWEYQLASGGWVAVSAAASVCRPYDGLPTNASACGTFSAISSSLRPLASIANEIFSKDISMR